MRHFKFEHIGWKKCKRCGAIVKDLNIHNIDYCQNIKSKKEKENKSIIYKDFLKQKRKGEGEIILDSYLLDGKENQNLMETKNNNIIPKLQCKLTHLPNNEINRKKPEIFEEKKLEHKEQQERNVKYVEVGVEAKLNDLNEIESKNLIEKNNSFTYLNITKKITEEIGIQVDTNKKSIEYFINKESFSYDVINNNLIEKKNNSKKMITKEFKKNHKINKEKKDSFLISKNDKKNNTNNYI